MQSQAVFGNLFSCSDLLDELRETLSPIEALLWCERILAQNDCEGLFGLVCKGLPIKPTPRELGPRFEDAEFLDAMRHDAERALLR